MSTESAGTLCVSNLAIPTRPHHRRRNASADDLLSLALSQFAKVQLGHHVGPPTRHAADPRTAAAAPRPRPRGRRLLGPSTVFTGFRPKPYGAPGFTAPDKPDGLRKGLDHLDEVRQTFQTITSRFAGYQAQWLNVHVDFPLLQRIALRITVGSVRYPGTKIHDVRVIRLFEVLLHGGPHVGGWTAKQIHQAVLTTFHLSEQAYGLNQLRYDLRKLKGHGLIERDGSRYAYRLTTKGVQVALLFLFFHKRLCGPIANSCFHHRPGPHHRPNSQLEAAYHRADKAIQKIVDVLAAA